MLSIGLVLQDAVIIEQTTTKNKNSNHIHIRIANVSKCKTNILQIIELHCVIRQTNVSAILFGWKYMFYTISFV